MGFVILGTCCDGTDGALVFMRLEMLIMFWKMLRVREDFILEDVGT
jgi:hypothetical protein